MRIDERFQIMQRQSFVCLALLALTMACGTPGASTKAEAPKVIKMDGLEEILSRKSTDLQVINFWATWCAPCIKELPYFEALNASDRAVDVTLISLDFADEFEKKVIPFVEKRELKSRVVLLDEIDYNAWIDKVDPSWSGAIPATLIVNTQNGKRKFVEKELSEGELDAMVDEMLN